MSTIRMGAAPQLTALCIALFFTVPGFADVSPELGGLLGEFKDSAALASFYGCIGKGNTCEGSGCDCGSSCLDSCCGSCCKGKLLGFIAPTPSGFDSFISPMTNPFFFEDPRTLTEVRAVFIHHDVPSNVLGGGDVQAFAVQMRAALTERLSIIAVKDGFLFGQPNVHPDGWVDVTAGLKYLLFSDPCSQSLLSAGFTYEIPLGSHRALQGDDDGDFVIFTSMGKRFGNYVHWLNSTGVRLAVDQVRGSDLVYSSNHLDYQMSDYLYPFLELNWFHWTRSGGAGVAGLEGNDIYNLGSTNVVGNKIVTMGTGMKVKPRNNIELGCVYEFPLTTRKDLLQSRLTVDCIIRY